MSELRKLTMEHVQKDTDTMDLPVVFTGTLSDCNSLAREQGCIWKNSRKYKFCGYWHKPATLAEEGYCLLVSK